MPTVFGRYSLGDSTASRHRAGGSAAGGGPVILMVSGGADSTALFIMALTGELDINDGRGTAPLERSRLCVLHVNHMLREAAADGDEDFVRGLAQSWEVPCWVRRIDVAAAARRSGENLEDAGRRLRYEAAEELANTLCDEKGLSHGSARILTAHTADDRAETFFMNAIRGSGATGLASIPRVRNRIVRPLLDLSHEDCKDYLRRRGIGWREDATNRDTRHLRAYMRREVLPAVKQKNPRVLQALSATCDLIGDEDNFLTMLASRLLRDLTLREESKLLILDAEKLGATELVLARRIIRIAALRLIPDARLEFRHIQEVLLLVAKRGGSVNLPQDLRVRLEHGALIFRSPGHLGNCEPGWLEVPGTRDLGDGRRITARLLELPPSNIMAYVRTHAGEWQGSAVLLDGEAAGIDPVRGGRLWVDVPAPGDVICPLGMHGRTKKVSDLLQEAHLLREDRAEIPLVKRGPDKEILWLVGIRMDERVKCSPQTNLLLELSVADTVWSDEVLAGW